MTQEEKLEAQYERARAKVGDGIDYDLPPPTTLLGEMLLLALIETGPLEPDASIMEYVIRERLHEVLACPGCRESAECPEHGKVGDFTTWMHAKIDTLWREDATTSLPAGLRPRPAFANPGPVSEDEDEPRGSVVRSFAGEREVLARNRRRLRLTPEMQHMAGTALGSMLAGLLGGPPRRDEDE